MNPTRRYFCQVCADYTTVKQCVVCGILDGEHYPGSDHLRCCRRQCSKCRSRKVQVRKLEWVKTVWGEVAMEEVMK